MNRLDCFFLQFHVGGDIKMRCLDTFMAQPHRDHSDVVIRLQHVHGSGVTQRVRRDSLVFERRTRLAGLPNRFVQTFSHAKSRHCNASGVGKERLIGTKIIGVDPSAKVRRRAFPQRQDTFLSAFAPQMECAARSQHYVRHARSHDFRDASAGVVHGSEEGTVSFAAPGIGVGRVQNRIEFLVCQEVEHSLVGTFGWDGQQSVEITGECRLSPLQVFGECPNCRQPEVARRVTVLSRVLQIVEEVHDVLSREVSDRDVLGCDLVLLLKIPQESTQCVAIRPHGVETALSLLRQVLCQEELEVSGDIRFDWLHDRPPFRGWRVWASKRLAQCSSRAGTALRYQ